MKRIASYILVLVVSLLMLGWLFQCHAQSPGARVGMLRKTVYTPPTPPPSLSQITSNHVYSGSDKMLIYTPPNLDSSRLYPVVYFFHGDGQRGVATNNTYSVGTGNGSQTVWSGNMNNTDKIIHSEFFVQVNSDTVATGRFGTITGTGVTGTYDYDDGSSAAFSITFSAPVTNGHAIQFRYTQSNLLDQGPFRYANLGDQPQDVFLVAPQISAPTGGFNTNDHWTAAINYMLTNNYPIDINRLYSTGLSLGGIFGVLLLSEVATLTYPCAAFIDVSPGATAGVPASGAAAWSTTTRMGKLIIRGTSDTFGQSQLPSAMANCNNADREFPFQGLVYWNIGHSIALWDTKVYNRKNRTDATGTAEFDYIEDFLTLFSLVDTVQARLWTERAEATNDSGDYRVAKRLTDNLSASSQKTALLSRLSTVLSNIGTITIIDVGTAFRSTAGNYNNLTSASAGTTITNLIRFDTGGATAWDFEMDVAPAATPATIDDIGSQRVQGRQFGVELNTTRDGHRIGSEGTTGTMLFTDLDNSKTYTFKIYASNQNTGSPTARAEIEVVFDSTTKFMYVDMCNFGGGDGMTAGNYVQFVQVPASGLVSGTLRIRQTASTEREAWLQAIEIIEHP